MSGYDEGYNYTFLVTNGLYGPAIAAVVGLEVIIAISANLLVLILTFRNPLVLKQPSIIFLTNLAVANLVLSFFSVTAYAVTSGNEEWVFGVTEEQKIITCEFQGFMKTSSLLVTSFALTFLSIDRCLFVTKSMFYRTHQKPWIAVAASVGSWIISGIICATPLIGLGMYVFDTNSGSCSQEGGSQYFRVIVTLSILSCAATILITTLWTFCFTFKFIKGLERRTASMNKDPNHVYNRRVKKVFGIFGALLSVTVLTFIPLSCVPVIKAIFGDEHVPVFLPSVGITSYFSSTVFYPIIQCYFRQDLREAFTNICGKLHS